MPYYSDRECVKSQIILSEHITINVWNGIAGIVNRLISNNNLAKDFPRRCPEGNGIYGVDEHNFYTSTKAIIPTINFLPQDGDIENLSNNYFDTNPFEESDISNEKKIQFEYDVLDFIEFVFKHICDVENDHYHDYFKHYELKFPTTTLVREQFVSDVNEIFERNNIAFKLTSTGEIQRIIIPELDNLIASTSKPNEKTLRSLLHEATTKIKKHKIAERKIALEKLWDAFERLKTIEKPNDKKHSVTALLDKGSGKNTEFKELLEEECKKLTSIGNKFQIRHFEIDKIAVEESQHLDYLFFRMYALIQLLLKWL